MSEMEFNDVESDDVLDGAAEKGYVSKIAGELGVRDRQVVATIDLLNSGATVPFISRYRKEATGTLDEVAITAIRDRVGQLRDLDKRRKTILDTIAESGKLTDALKAKILAAETMAVLEDLYLPYKPKRRTRATIAREKGLEPLASLIFEQEQVGVDLQAEAAKYVDAEKEVKTVDEALAGSRDIIAEWVSENQDARAVMRKLYQENGVFCTSLVTGKEEEAQKYKDYFEWEEPVATAPSHRVLAMRRGAREKFLTLRILVPEELAVKQLDDIFVTNEGECANQIRVAIKDSFSRLLSLSMATEMRLETKKRADQDAIKVFAENLRQLLLGSPLGQKNVLALDPGFRTGCKVVCLDRQGKLVHDDVVYIHSGDRQGAAGAEKLAVLCQKFEIECIAVGNGTASRETEAFVKAIEFGREIPLVMVNESGASIYSASEVARDEFPDKDVTVRGAVSIGRRLMDPLAELVKIDPKSIGVGQYQHDVDQTMLKESLDDTVVSCVNNVGVEVNTASKQLLTYVSGLGPQLADNIVKYRNENGPFTSRKDLKKVPKLGDKTFEQCAGFLRIRGGENELDGSAVHPERYAIVYQMAEDLKCSVADLIKNESLRNKIDLHKYVTDEVGLPTLSDIKAELSKPGRDPREAFVPFKFDESVHKIEDLCEGMQLPGIVTNITAFGAFVDVGVHQDGLVHISQMADRFIKDPADVVKVHQKVMVTVVEVDVPRKRIALSMKNGKGGGGGKKDAGKKPAKKRNDKPAKPGFLEMYMVKK